MESCTNYLFLVACTPLPPSPPMSLPLACLLYLGAPQPPPSPPTQVHNKINRRSLMRSYVLQDAFTTFCDAPWSHVLIFGSSKYLYTKMCTYVCINICVCLLVYMNIYVYIYLYLYVYLYIYV